MGADEIGTNKPDFATINQCVNCVHMDGTLWSQHERCVYTWMGRGGHSMNDVYSVCTHGWDGVVTA